VKARLAEKLKGQVLQSEKVQRRAGGGGSPAGSLIKSSGIECGATCVPPVEGKEKLGIPEKKQS